MMAADEEVVVCTRSCEMIGVNWDGTFDFNFQWSLKCGSLSDSTSGIVQDCPVSEIQYSAMIKGFALVFTNGRAAFFPLPETEMETSNDGSSSQRYALPKMQFIPEVDNAQSTSVNHRFQLLAFGLSNAEVLLCCVDAEDDLLQVAITHRLKLPASALPDAAAQVGGVCCLQWSPDGTVLATAWQHGGFALWSVFGALLSCSLLWDHGLSCSSSRFRQNAFNSLSWAAEGFQLWMLERKSQEQSQLSQLALAKSVLASNPSCISTCSEHVLLMAEDKLYLGVGVTPGSIRARIGSDEPDTEPLTPGPSQLNSSASAFDLSDSSYPDSQTEQEPYDVGNHQWVIVPLPAQYTSDNSPIRFCAMDELGQHLVIARRYGFAYYSLATRRWKLFGNETQERDFEVLGGLLWNQGYILLACYNSADSRYELRAYPQRTKLDNQFASITPVPCQVMLMAVHQNRILVLLIDGSLNVYNFEVNSDSPMISGNTNGMSYTNHSYSLNQGGPPLRFLYRAVHNVRFAPECVSCVLLTSIRSEDGAINRGSQPDSILMNVCGRLILLEPDPHILQPELSESSSLPISLQNNVHLVGYRFRNTLASGVENVWLNQQSSENVQRPHLTNALWLARGANGMSVWLPLTPFAEQQHNTSQSRAFISRRIMLPINTHIYPLAVRFKDALVLGAENDTIVCGRVEPINRPFCVVAKTSQVYLHHILRELLRRK